MHLRDQIRRFSVEFRTRSKSRVLRDLIAKLESLPPRHPDRPHLIRMILGLRRELERAAPQRPLAADD
jgi:hypothetical protein